MDLATRYVLRAFRAAPWRLLASALAAAFVLGACTPSVTAELGESGEVRVTTESSGASRIVRVPESRPSQGLRVSRDQAGARSFRIPPGHYPPPGQCRVWHPDVPPGQQDPPGDCDELERQVPPGAYLVQG